MGYLKNTINAQRASLIPLNGGKAGASIPDISTKLNFLLSVASVSGNVLTIKTPITGDGAEYATLFEAGLQLGMIVVDATTNESSIVVDITDSTLTVKNGGGNFTGSEVQVYGGFQNGALVYIGNAGSAASPNINVITSGGDDVTFKGVSAGDVLPVQVTQVINVSEEMSDLIALW
jgi:hypothetical protein